MLWFYNSIKNETWSSSHDISYILQELKSRYSGITLLMTNTMLGIYEILHWSLCYKHSMWKTKRIELELSHISYMWYLRELKSRYSGITLLMINTMLGIYKILHWSLCYKHSMWKNKENWTRIISYILHVILTRIKI